MSPRTALFVFAACLFSTASSAAHCWRYEPSKIVVTGHIFERSDWGPPNYGENPKTDSHERHLFIRLNAPLCVMGDQHGDTPNTQTEMNVKTIGSIGT